MVRHPGNIVGDDARRAFGGDLLGITGRERPGLGHPGGEEIANDLPGLAMAVLELGAEIEILVEELFRFAAQQFHFRGKGGETAGRAANAVEIGDPIGLARGFGDEVVGEGVEHELERLLKEELLGGGGMAGLEGGKVALDEGDAAADVVDGEDFGFDAVVKVGGEPGDLVGPVDELSLERRAFVEEIRGELGMIGGGVVAGVLDDAFAHGEGEIEAAEVEMAVLKKLDDAEGVEIVVEAEAVLAERVVEGALAGVAEGGMADVVGEGEGFGEVLIEAEGAGGGAGDLGDFEGVGEAAAEMVGGALGEDLGFAGEAAKGAGVEDAADVALEGGAVGMGRLGAVALTEWAERRDSAGRGQRCGQGRGAGHGGSVEGLGGNGRGGSGAGGGKRRVAEKSGLTLLQYAICLLRIAIGRGMKLSDKLRYLREVEGSLRGLGRSLSQQELVRAIGAETGGAISQSYLSQIESGARPHLTNTTRQALAKFFKVHPGYLVDDPEGYHAELMSDARALDDKLDLWLVAGAERFRRDMGLRHALLGIARHEDSRRCLLLLNAVIETPGLVDRLFEVLHGTAGSAPGGGAERETVKPAKGTRGMKASRRSGR